MKSIEQLKEEYAYGNGYPTWAEYYNWICRTTQRPAITGQLIESAMEEVAKQYAQQFQSAPAKWTRGSERLPSLFKKVKWRNADGGNIPLPDATPLEHYQKAGANIEWHEWLCEGKQSQD